MSNWTTSGTVSVENNSRKVFGAGTPWVSNGKTRPGDEFIAPNGARHEVESVQSNTELTLVAPYMGVTASGQSYALIHTGLLPAELAVKISDLQSKYLTTIAQLYEWETSLDDTVPITNPATGVTMQVKPLSRFLSSLGDGSMAGAFTTLSASGALTTNGIKEDAAGNVGIGVTPNAKLDFAAVSRQSFGVAGAATEYRSTNASGSAFAKQTYNAISYDWGLSNTFGKMVLDEVGNLLVGAKQQAGKLTVRNAGVNQVTGGFYCDDVTGPNYGVDAVSAASAADSVLFRGFHSGGTQCFAVAGTGNVTNTNNAYGAISDIKHKERITDASPVRDKLMLVRIVNYFLKTDPTHKLLGVIAQELELIFPGVIEETPDYEDVEVTPAHTEPRVTPRQKVEFREDVRYEITEVDGKWTKLPITTTVEVPLFNEFPLFDETGAAVMECVEAAQAEVLGENREVISPAKDAVWRQSSHRVPVMEDVTETVEVPAVVERRATGEVTKSVKYSVFVPMLIKAMQEQQMVIEGLEARITTLEAA